jgi:hypothetical protein
MTLEGGSLIFLGVLILFFIGVIIALYTRRGTGVALHPYRHTYGGAPASALPCNDYSGADRTSVTERDVVRAWRRRRLAQDPDVTAAQLTEARARRRRERSQVERITRLPIRSPLGTPRQAGKRPGA